MQKHLAIFKSGEEKAIFAGKKTIESRFSQKKIAPFGMISSGDIVYIKPSGKDVVGQFKVKKVIFYDGITDEDWQDLKKSYQKQLQVDEKFWEMHQSCRFGTLIFIGQVDQFITSPIKINKKDGKGWVVMDPETSSG